MVSGHGSTWNREHTIQAEDQRIMIIGTRVRLKAKKRVKGCDNLIMFDHSSIGLEMIDIVHLYFNVFSIRYFVSLTKI